MMRIILPAVVVIVLILGLNFNQSIRMFVTADAFRSELVIPVSGKILNPPTFANSKPNTGLSNAIGSALLGTQGIYAVVVKNLKTGETFSVNENRIFKSASLYKLWIMGTVYSQIQQGLITKDDPLNADVEAINREFGLSDEYADLTSGTINTTVKKATEQMITISHNYSALLLAKKIKISNVRQYLTGLGLENTTIGGTPLTTAHDVALFLEKLYQGKLGSENDTKEMIGLLKDQMNNNKIPKYLPNYLIIAHKTGELDTFSHDAGIIYSSSGDYILVVMSETDNPPGADDRIGKVSRAVFDYFQSHR